MSVPNSQKGSLSFQWQWNWKILLFVAFFLPVTINLAFWQMSRAEEKRQLLEVHQQRAIAAPVVISQLSEDVDYLYVRVTVTGEYANETQLLLDNRVRRGRPGYEVITPFHTDEGERLLVNRGWIETGLDRSVLPEITTVQGKVTLTGYLYRSLGKQLMLGEDIWSKTNGPIVIQNADPMIVSQKLEQDFYKYHLRLEADAPGALETGWQIVNVQPGKHTGYAVQWSALALALVILAIFANSNLGAVIASRRTKKKSSEME